jgi:hypothetical protein
MEALKAHVVMDLICYTTAQIYAECIDHLMETGQLRVK